VLKVVAVSDKQGTAIDRLCRGTIEYNHNIEYVVCDIHPKRPDRDQLNFFEQHMDADIFDYQYFRSADMLRERYPEIKNKPSILTHNNPYSIHERDWNDYQIVVANNKTMQADLSTITASQLEYIPLCVDTDFWEFKQDWQPKDQVIMVANRIESKKGIAPVANACNELGLKLILVGAISDRNYFEGEVLGNPNVMFYEQISDMELRELYYESLLHICNSRDNFESGTLPILESMLCGTPVLTRKVGHVPDLYNKENMYIYDGDPEDVLALKDRIKQVIDDRKNFEQIRDKAWNTAKTRSMERRAYSYQRLYRSLVSNETPVSIITPIFDKPQYTTQCLEAIAAQDYPNIEAIICNDNPMWRANKKLVEEWAREVSFPVRFINKPSAGYAIAKQRNLGITEATGDILIFCDQRIVMEKNAVSKLVAAVQPRTWVYGTKGVKKDFVENFSAVYRDDVIKLGGFNERINKYGGQSQEIRSRAKYNGYQVNFIPDAVAKQIGKSSSRWQKKDQIIEMKNKLWKLGLEL